MTSDSSPVNHPGCVRTDNRPAPIEETIVLWNGSTPIRSPKTPRTRYRHGPRGENHAMNAIPKIEVQPNVWGDANLKHLRAVLERVAETFLAPFDSDRPYCRIKVKKGTDYPEVKPRSSDREPYIIELNSTGRKWAQITYQFAHELCHITSKFESRFRKRNQWFDEVLCEVASLWTLCRLAETWDQKPPYPPAVGSAPFGPKLRTYVEGVLGDPKRKLPQGVTFPAWIALEEGSMRATVYQRDKEGVVAAQLLPLFETEPKTWRTVRHLPISEAQLSEFVPDWHANSPDNLKPFVVQIALALGVKC